MGKNSRIEHKTVPMPRRVKPAASKRIGMTSPLVQDESWQSKYWREVKIPTTHVMCKKCGRINSKNKAEKHRRSHNVDGAKAKRDRNREERGNFTKEEPRLFWTELEMPGRCIDDMWPGREPDLRDPTDIYEMVYGLFLRKVRVPMPFANFGVVPIWRVWNETKGYPEFLYEPSKEDRYSLWLRHAIQLKKENDRPSFGAPFVGTRQYKNQGVQTYLEFETQKTMRKKVNYAQQMMKQESDQVREELKQKTKEFAAREQKYLEKYRGHREKLRSQHEIIQARDKEIKELKQQLRTMKKNTMTDTNKPTDFMRRKMRNVRKMRNGRK